MHHKKLLPLLLSVLYGRSIILVHSNTLHTVFRKRERRRRGETSIQTPMRCCWRRERGRRTTYARGATDRERSPRFVLWKKKKRGPASKLSSAASLSSSECVCYLLQRRASGGLGKVTREDDANINRSELNSRQRHPKRFSVSVTYSDNSTSAWPNTTHVHTPVTKPSND